MKKLIIISGLILTATFARAQQKPAIYDYSTRNLVSITNSIANTNGLYLTTQPIGNLTVSNNLTVASNAVARINKAEIYLTNGTAQAFTSAAGFTVVTNFQSVTRGHFTATSTSIVTHVTGDICAFLSMSSESSVNSVETESHLFTNGVEISHIGWWRKIANAGDTGSAAGNGLILNVPSGTVFTVENRVDKNTTMTYDHFSLILMQQ